MTRRVAVIGTTIAIVAMGLVFLVLWQTGVISRHTRTWAAADVPQAQAPAPVPAPENPQGKAAVELKRFPVPGDGKVPGADDQAASTPQPAGSPPVQAGSGAEKPVSAPQVGAGERRYPGQEQVGKPECAPQMAETAAQGKKESHAGVRHSYKPVVVRFGFDPDRDPEINVAIVHSGDRVAVQVRPAEQAGCRLYLTFDSSGTLETKAYLEWSTASRRARVAPIGNGTRITLAAAGDFGVGVPGKLNTKGGAVLKIGADCFAGGWERLRMDDWGSYEIEMRIYQGNRWNIRPKSLL